MFKRINRKYSAELKLTVVQEYLSVKGSLRELAKSTKSAIKSASENGFSAIMVIKSLGGSVLREERFI